ncbi:MAG TPA: hypothetical protein VIL72_04615 [Beijerinckiaceae bacterium]
MKLYRLRLLDAEGTLRAERCVRCAQVNDVWRHADAMADADEAGARLHVLDERGDVLALTGVRAAKALAAFAA